METRALVTWGNAIEDGLPHRGWLIGAFKDPATALYDQTVEVKVDHCEKGKCRPKEEMTADATKRTLQLLIIGKVKTSFFVPMAEPGQEPQEFEVILSEPLQYCLWETGQMHWWEILEDSIVVTIRWWAS